MLNLPEESDLPEPETRTDPDHFSYCSLNDLIRSSRFLSVGLFSGFELCETKALGLGEAGDAVAALGTATVRSPVCIRGSFGFISGGVFTFTMSEPVNGSGDSTED